jgi:hypothetical protein
LASGRRELLKDLRRDGSVPGAAYSVDVDASDCLKNVAPMFNFHHSGQRHAFFAAPTRPAAAWCEQLARVETEWQTEIKFSLCAGTAEIDSLAEAHRTSASVSPIIHGTVKLQQ